MIGSTLIDANRQSLEMVAEIQDRVVKANRDLADSVTNMTGNLPLPDLNLPIVVDADFVAQAFDMTAEWLQAGRKFTEDIVAAWMPEAPKATAAKK